MEPGTPSKTRDSGGREIQIKGDPKSEEKGEMRTPHCTQRVPWEVSQISRLGAGAGPSPASNRASEVTSGREPWWADALCDCVPCEVRSLIAPISPTKKWRWRNVSTVTRPARGCRRNPAPAASSNAVRVQPLGHTGFGAEILITCIPFSIIKHKNRPVNLAQEPDTLSLGCLP